MKNIATSEYEWFIAEAARCGSGPEAMPPLHLGPFSEERECRTLLEALKNVPRFGQGDMEVYKRRRGQARVRVALPIHISRPTAQNGRRLAHTIDISNSGARLGGLDEELKPGEILQIHYGRRCAPFQVVWAGSPGLATQGQAGVECLTPEANIWNLDFSDASNESLLQELAVARAVQKGLLPQEKISLRSLDYAGDCIQARTVGGDYYDIFRMDDNSVGFVLADVAGKGMSAALLMANLQGCLTNESGMGCNDLPRVLVSANHHFHHHSEPHRYATVFFGCYCDTTRRLRYVNCGHNAPLLLHPNNSVEQLSSTATVLGLFPEWDCSLAEVTLEAGSILAMYTDGITEATDQRGEEFGQTRLLECLRENRHLGAASVLDKVMKSVDLFRAGEQRDDLTLVIAQSQ